MRKSPRILVSPDIDDKGREFQDLSISLSANYQEALIGAGALPLTMPATLSERVIAECVEACDGVMLTGGDDVGPGLYTEGLDPDLRATVEVTPDGGARDLRELLVIREVFRSRKPLLAICRGHQILNVALGGTLVVDIARELPGALNHRRLDRRGEVVHEVQLTPGSLLAKITSEHKLGVNSTHHQAVGRVAALLQATAVSSDGVVEALELKDAAASWLPFLLGLQFHPERLVDKCAEHRRIFHAFARVCAQCQR
jgi:putative glutamine amidotransferase